MMKHALLQDEEQQPALVNVKQVRGPLTCSIFSFLSFLSIFSVLSFIAFASVGSTLSAFSSFSFLSLLSNASALSIFSNWSFLSLWSSHCVLCIDCTKDILCYGGKSLLDNHADFPLQALRDFFVQ